MENQPVYAVAPGGAKHEELLKMLIAGGNNAVISKAEEADARFYITPKLQPEEKLPHNVTPIEYLKRPDFKKQNGILTAEAAIAVAINETDFALSSCQALVIGSGAIAKPLIYRLRALGAFVTACARDTKALRKMRLDGINTCELCFLGGEYDLIFNTVPWQVLNEDTLKNLGSNAVIIDLASLPGGVNTEEAERYGFKVIRALALPGKYMPKTAAKIIYESVINAVKEMSL